MGGWIGEDSLGQVSKELALLSVPLDLRWGKDSCHVYPCLGRFGLLGRTLAWWGPGTDGAPGGAEAPGVTGTPRSGWTPWGCWAANTANLIW